VLVLDWEVQHPNPVEWCRVFAQHVHDLTNVWVLLYINLATLRAYDWSPVLNNCGLWIAAWTDDPNIDINTNGYPYVVHQYRGAPLDLDAVWLTMDQFKKFGYHVPQPTPAPQPIPVPDPVPTPTPLPTPEPVQPSDIDKENNTLLKQILTLLQDLVSKFTSIFK
jgi:hypothetical protein